MSGFEPPADFSFEVFTGCEIEEGKAGKATCILLNYPPGTPREKIEEIQQRVSGAIVEEPGYLPDAPFSGYDKQVVRYDGTEVTFHAFSYLFPTSKTTGTVVQVRRADNGFLGFDTPREELDVKLLVIIPD
ncbi:MAG: hypothetical protein V1820_01230, partial [archaeon]